MIYAIISAAILVAILIFIYSAVIIAGRCSRLECIYDELQPMDILYIDISPDDCGGIVVPRIPETLAELERYIQGFKSGEIILKGVAKKSDWQKIVKWY